MQGSCHPDAGKRRQLGQAGGHGLGRVKFTRKLLANCKTSAKSKKHAKASVLTAQLDALLAQSGSRPSSSWA